MRKRKREQREKAERENRKRGTEGGQREGKNETEGGMTGDKIPKLREVQNIRSSPPICDSQDNCTHKNTFICVSPSVDLNVAVELLKKP